MKRSKCKKILGKMNSEELESMLLEIFNSWRRSRRNRVERSTMVSKKLLLAILWTNIQTLLQLQKQNLLKKNPMSLETPDSKLLTSGLSAVQPKGRCLKVPKLSDPGRNTQDHPTEKYSKCHSLPQNQYIQCACLLFRISWWIRLTSDKLSKNWWNCKFSSRD